MDTGGPALRAAWIGRDRKIESHIHACPSAFLGASAISAFAFSFVLFVLFVARSAV
jgi:hypothetical protein